jgi:cell division protein FtsA
VIEGVSVAKECVVGLDIGTTKICAIVGEIGDDGRIEIAGLGYAASAGIRKGVVISIEDAASAIGEALAAARRDTNYEIRSVVVGVTGDHIASLNSKYAIAVTHSNRDITAADVEKVCEQARVIVLPPDREIIHSIPRSYTVDGQGGVRYPIGMSGTRLEVEMHIVTSAVTLLQNVAKSVNRAGLSVEAPVLEPIASAEAVVTPAEKDLGVALVDIGGGTTDIAIFANGDIAYSSAIPIGGSHITRDISIGLRLSLAEAERVKLAYGSADVQPAGADDLDLFECAALDGSVHNVSKRQLIEIIGPRIEEIFTLVNQEIVKSGYHRILTAGVVLTGGGALMPGVTAFCTRSTGFPARIGSPRDIIDLPDRLRSPAFATGLGLVLFAARYSHGDHAPKTPQKPLGASVNQKLGGFMQAVQKFFARITGTDADI